jgi:hypothetical protein
MSIYVCFIKTRTGVGQPQAAFTEEAAAIAYCDERIGVEYVTLTLT